MKWSKSVVVIGGGVSGLVAAATLSKASGYSVTLLEADNHIGGRVKSRRFGENFVEFGAEWVHGEKDNRVFEIMEPLGVLVNEPSSHSDSESRETVENPFENLIFATQSGEVMNTRFNKRIGEIFHVILEGDDEDESVNSKKEDSLGERAVKLFEEMNEESPVHGREGIGNAALDFIHRYVNILDSADTWFQTSPGGTDGEHFEYCEGNKLVGWKLPANYSSVLRVILGQSPTETGPINLPKWVHLGKEVVEIIYSTSDDSPVTISCKDGTIFHADHVITTVSLGVLKQNHSTLFIPNLPEKKQTAIQSLGFGTANKIYLEFPTCWWEVEDEGEPFQGVGFLWEDVNEINANWSEDSTNEDLLKENDEIPVWCRSLIGFNVVENHPRVLQGWISGVSSRFMETLDLDYVTASCFKVLKQFLGKEFDNIPAPINSARSTWSTNPFTRGSYSFRTVEAEIQDVWAKDLASPILNHKNKPILTFAGEATHEKYYSTVNGAYDTGVREAKRIMEFYGKS